MRWVCIDPQCRYRMECSKATMQVTPCPGCGKKGYFTEDSYFPMEVSRDDGETWTTEEINIREVDPEKSRLHVDDRVRYKGESYIVRINAGDTAIKQSSGLLPIAAPEGALYLERYTTPPRPIGEGVDLLRSKITDVEGVYVHFYKASFHATLKVTQIEANDGSIKFHFDSGVLSVWSDASTVRKVPRPDNMIVNCEWCFSIKNEYNEHIGFVLKM